ncbi:MAG: hypothetical protein HY510_05335 [Acidobacteria bacterium]|nr:hypothetical protein [Acidobacteriota bacterium]
MSPRRRAAALTLLLLVIPAILFIPGIREAVGPGHYRLLVFWGLPLAAGFLSLLVYPRLPAAPGAAPAGRSSMARALRMLPWLAAASFVDQSFLAPGSAFGWSTYTFGDQYLSGNLRTAALWTLPLCLLLGIFGWERALRGGVLGAWAGHLSRPAALAVSAGVGVAIASPIILQGSQFTDVPFILAAFLAAVSREIACGVIFLSHGVMLAGIYRGWLYFLEGVVISDLNSLFFAAANYTTSEPRFYALRGLAALLAAALVGLGARRTARPGADDLAGPAHQAGHPHRAGPEHRAGPPG